MNTIQKLNPRHRAQVSDVVGFFLWLEGLRPLGWPVLRGAILFYWLTLISKLSEAR